MPRLIDANEILKSEHQHYDYMSDEYYVLVLLHYSKPVIDIENAPTVEPVRHGRWVHGKELSRDYIGDVCVSIHYDKCWCSECDYPTEGHPLWKYCPNCGAKMNVETGNTYSIGKIELPTGVFRQIYDEERREDETD